MGVAPKGASPLKIFEGSINISPLCGFTWPLVKTMLLALLAPLNFVDSLLLRFFSEQTVNYIIWPFIQVGAVVTITALWVAYATYLERKISAFMQARLGPMRVGPWGLLQPIADGLKLLVKEDFIPENADRWIFFIAPYIAVVAAFIVLAVVPFGPDWAVITDVNIGILFVLAVSSVGVLALILAGWSSNSKYALLGALRSSAQMVSYEVAMGLAIIGALMFARTLAFGHRRGAAIKFDLVSALPTDWLRDLFDQRDCGKQSRSVRFAGSGIRTGRRLSH